MWLKVWRHTSWCAGTPHYAQYTTDEAIKEYE